MARLQKDVVNYFPHDANASTGDTLTVLQSRFGNDGYAFWFKLLEKLASTDGHYIDCQNPAKFQVFLAKMGVDEVTTVEIMNLLVEMQAIDKDLWTSKLIWCQNLVDNLADVYKNRRREIPQKPLITGNKAITTGDNVITTGESTQSKVKETKLKESIYIAYPEFPNVNKMTKEEHQKLIEKFGEAGARDRVENLSLYIASKGDKYKNHYATILAWDKRDKKGGQGGAHRQDSTKLPPRDGYTKPPPNARLDKLVEQQRAAKQVPGLDELG